MATTITSAYLIFLLICIINIISSYPTNAASSETTTPIKPRALAIKLIHHDSIHSPYYNPKATISERVERAINDSLARVGFLSKTIAASNDNDVRASLVTPGTVHAFLANISIGTPPVPQLVVIDTASDLLWIQCLPCNPCFKQSPPLFDPAMSSTYSNIPCGFLECSMSRGKCESDDKNCTYERSYADNTSTAGNLASELVTFETSDEGTVKVPIEVLGCGHTNQYVDAPESGILGLSYGYNHWRGFVEQFGSKFSYCLGNIFDTQYQYNQLILGDGAIMQGDSTTLESDSGHYYVDLEGISVGEKALPIAAGAFQRGPSGEGGVMIDSGSTFTFLKEEGYVALQNEVESLMAGKLTRVRTPSSLCCYSGSVETNLTGFPVVALRFSGGAQLVLDTNSMFVQLTEDVLCMAVFQSSPSDNGLSIIGVIAQQSYNVGYDILNDKIFFQRIDCGLLESRV